MKDSVRAVLISNPNARQTQSEEGRSTLQRCRERMQDAGWHLETIEANSREQAISRLRSAAEHCEVVVVAGGDGSINTAVQVVGDSHLALGVLPLGTANDFAKAIGISDNADDACEQLLRGHERRVDLGEVNGHLFVNAIGFGIGSKLSEVLDRDTKARWGVLGYPLALLKAWKTSRPFHAAISGEFPTITQACLQITIANSPYFGGGMKIDEAARADDGVFDLQAIEPVTLPQLLLEARRLRGGEARAVEFVHVQTARSFDVHTTRRLPVSVDGELLSSTPVRCRKRPRALRVLAPLPSEDCGDGPQAPRQ